MISQRTYRTAYCGGRRTPDAAVRVPAVAENIGSRFATTHGGVKITYGRDMESRLAKYAGYGLWDPNSLFTCHLARFRDGERFISYDSYEADPTTPASLHKYLYASVNPVAGIDPTGMWDSAGHFWTTYMVAVATGRYTEPQAYALANYSELPDAFGETDPVTQGMISLTPSQEVDYDQIDHNLQVNDVLHGLHNRDYVYTIARTRALAALIPTSTGWQQGVYIHAFGDAFSHTKNDGTSWGGSIGHGWEGHDPDIISLHIDRYCAYVVQLYSLLGGKDVDHNYRLQYLLTTTRNGYFGVDKNGALQMAEAKILADIKFGYSAAGHTFVPSEKTPLAPDLFNPTAAMVCDLIPSITAAIQKTYVALLANKPTSSATPDIGPAIIP